MRVLFLLFALLLLLVLLLNSNNNLLLADDSYAGNVAAAPDAPPQPQPHHRQLLLKLLDNEHRRIESTETEKVLGFAPFSLLLYSEFGNPINIWFGYRYNTPTVSDTVEFKIWNNLANLLLGFWATSRRTKSGCVRRRRRRSCCCNKAINRRRRKPEQRRSPDQPMHPMRHRLLHPSWPWRRLLLGDVRDRSQLESGFVRQPRLLEKWEAKWIREREKEEKKSRNIKEKTRYFAWIVVVFFCYHLRFYGGGGKKGKKTFVVIDHFQKQKKNGRRRKV